VKNELKGVLRVKMADALARMFADRDRCLYNSAHLPSQTLLIEVTAAISYFNPAGIA
jgi:hypothetical protein